MKIGFIGAGRLAKALAWHAAQCGLNIHAVASRQRVNALALADPIPGCQVLEPQQVADTCDLVFITTPDAALQTIADHLQWRSGVYVVHCSGATPVDVLAHAAQQGAFIGGFHPLQAFADPATAVQSLPGSTITIEASHPPLQNALVTIAELMGCQVNHLPAGARALYHAAAGYTSQFVNVLFYDAARIWASWGGTEDQAVNALMPLIRGLLAGIGQVGIAPSMPGPVSRGDVDSISRHVHALAALNPDMLPVYCAMCRTTVDIALRSQRIDQETANRFFQILDRVHRD